MLLQIPDEVARIGALSNGSNGQRSLESASLHFEALCKREQGIANAEVAGEILSVAPVAKDLLFLQTLQGRYPGF
jgi:hypothetical protein